LFDSSYFQSYARDPGDWERGYRARLYYYKSLLNALFHLKRDPVEVAEIGCGLGMFSYALLSARPQLVLRASDISDYAVSVAGQKLARFPNAQVQLVNGEEIGLRSDSCDVVVSLDVVEHLPRPERMLDQVFHALKPGGLFLFTTPNGRSLGARLKRHVPMDDPGAARDSHWIWSAHKDPTHVNIRKPDEWRRACTAAGFSLVRDGSDGCWDTPYVRGVPLFIQKLIFNGSHRLLMRLSPRLPWQLGENYIGFWRKP
jgi:2-polyprenyl-3-methyl-5-hydroxy-6-metoxy-1,4-benzoquinol methylase